MNTIPVFDLQRNSTRDPTTPAARHPSKVHQGSGWQKTNFLS